MKARSLFFAFLVLFLGGCSPSIETLSFEGKIDPPTYPEVSTDGWVVAAADMSGLHSTPPLGEISGKVFSAKVQKKGLLPENYVLSVRHPGKNGVVLAKILGLRERKDLKGLTLDASSTLAAMAFQFAAGIGDRAFLGVDPARIEGLVPPRLLYRFERAYEAYLARDAKNTESAPAASPSLVLESYRSLLEALERSPN